MKLMNETLDEIRRLEQKEVNTAKQKSIFEDLSRRNLKTARAYRMKLALQEVYQSPDRATAEEGL
ncbi:MAG: transposase [Firmicutes bacterium]|nr:transposase [Bacillota bacterium]